MLNKSWSVFQSQVRSLQTLSDTFQWASDLITAPSRAVIKVLSKAVPWQFTRGLILGKSLTYVAIKAAIEHLLMCAFSPALQVSHFLFAIFEFSPPSKDPYRRAAFHMPRVYGYPQFVIPIHESSPQQNVLVTEVPVHESSLLIAANHVPVTFLDIRNTHSNSAYSPYDNSTNRADRAICYMDFSGQLFLIILLPRDIPWWSCTTRAIIMSGSPGQKGRVGLPWGPLMWWNYTHSAQIPSYLPEGPFSPTSFDTVHKKLRKHT